MANSNGRPQSDSAPIADAEIDRPFPFHSRDSIESHSHSRDEIPFQVRSRVKFHRLCCLFAAALVVLTRSCQPTSPFAPDSDLVDIVNTTTGRPVNCFCAARVKNDPPIGLVLFPPFSSFSFQRQHRQLRIVLRRLNNELRISREAVGERRPA